jgi:hypothetical protein
MTSPPSRSPRDHTSRSYALGTPGRAPREPQRRLSGGENLRHALIDARLGVMRDVTHSPRVLGASWLQGHQWLLSRPVRSSCRRAERAIVPATPQSSGQGASHGSHLEVVDQRCHLATSSGKIYSDAWPRVAQRERQGYEVESSSGMVHSSVRTMFSARRRLVRGLRRSDADSWLKLVSGRARADSWRWSRSASSEAGSTNWSASRE